MATRGRSLGGAILGLVLAAAGCGGESAPTAPLLPYKGTKIVVAAVDDPAILATVGLQRGEWEASREASCSVVEKAIEPGSIGGAHVLVFRGDRLGDLMDRDALAVLPESVVRPLPKAPSDPDAPAPPEETVESEAELTGAAALRFDDVLPAFRDQVSRYGENRVALPYGGSGLVLVLNRAALERDDVKAAAQAAGIALEAPKTWERLDALAKFLQGRDWDGDGQPDHGLAVALGDDSEGVADAVYLARAVSLGQHRDHYSFLFNSDSMEPRVASPPFVEALEGYAGWKAFGPLGAEGFDAEAAREAFRKGNIALLIDRAEKVGRWGGGGAKRITVAQLPGSERVYEPLRQAWETTADDAPNRPSYLPFGGGWLVGVSSAAQGKEREAAIDFVTYLIHPETSNRVRLDASFPMLPVRSSQVLLGITDPRSAPGVESRPWADAVNKTLLAPKVVPGLRIPDARGYLADLSKARTAAVKGEAASKALGGLAEAWSARTRTLGTERQLWHYRRTLNALVTTPRPPARESR